MGPWSEHGNAWYNCNRYDEKSGQDARTEQQKSRAQLERYLHYFNRYANHEQSAKLERDLYLRTEKKMEQMQLTSDVSNLIWNFTSHETKLFGRVADIWCIRFLFFSSPGSKFNSCERLLMF